MLIKVSIIIRTKNEERWITLCLKEVYQQTYKDIEVVIVDNNSTDRTVEKAKSFPVKIININHYLPGKALNLGIKNSTGDVIICLSGHCIPVSKHWLQNLITDLDNPKVAGVYGRQEPLSFSSDPDKRDLLTTFGLDKKVQKKDSFFHNANSSFRRKIWEHFPFDEETSNIEDRIWGQQVITAGYHIIYEPEAGVYHYHGIHQDNDPQRCRNVVHILESLENGHNGNNNGKLCDFDISSLNIAAIIPVKDEIRYCNNKPLIEYTLQNAFESKHISNVFVSTDNEGLALHAKKCGATVPFIRPPELSKEFIDVNAVLQYTLKQLEEKSHYPDIIVVMEVTYPFRPPGFIDKAIEKFVRGGFDSLMPAKPEFRSLWIQEGESVKMFGKFMPRQLKKEKTYISLFGLGYVTYPKFIRNGRLIGDNVGIFEVIDNFASIEIRDKRSEQLAGTVLASNITKPSLPELFDAPKQSASNS